MSKLTEQIELPSKGFLYPPSSSLSSGHIEIKYPTTHQEDILTNINYIKNRTVIDKLLQSLIVDKINYNDLLIGDKNTIMVAARILMYGKDYTFDIDNPEVGEKPISITVDLTALDEKILNKTLLVEERNEIAYELPISKANITFKLLTHGDELEIEKELAGLKKAFPNGSPVISTRLKHTIVSVDGKRDSKTVREFVDNMLSQDSKALRKYINEVTPNTELKYSYDFGNGFVEEFIPITSNFFWPD